MNRQQLAQHIWEAANKMRSKIEANEYKDYILGFMFYKFISEQEVQFLKSQDYSEDDIIELSEEDVESVAYVQDNLGYFISYDNLFSTWLKMGKDFGVSLVRDALSAFNRLIDTRHKKTFSGIFKTLETGLSKLGADAASQTKAIAEILSHVDKIPMSSKQDYDVLGFIYEYLISNFAANAGKKAGEFYTPHEVSVLMSEIVAHHLKGRDEIKIYDPTSGSGSLLINIGQSVAKYLKHKDNITYYAQELKENTYNLTRMNLVMRGIKSAKIITRNADTLEDDWPYFDESDPQRSYNPLYVDAVVSNPPYSQTWEPEHGENDPRYARFGLAPKKKADYAFLLHDLYHVQPHGIMTIVLPHGVLFRGGEERNIRKNLIEFNHIDTIIGLPANIFFGTGIPTIVIVLKQQRTERDILIIDASKGFVKQGKNNKLRACDIKRIVDTITARSNAARFSRRVPIDEIRDNDYNLNLPRYVDSSPPQEQWDIYATMFGGIPKTEIDELSPYWQAFPALRSKLFVEDESIPCAQLAVEQVDECIAKHPEIQAFQQQYNDAFEDFDDKWREQLTTRLMDINVEQEKDCVTTDIFSRLEGIALIDKYDAYQILSEAWQDISTDLEIIQSEGFDSIRAVDPRMVEKTIKGKKQEVQDGYEGRILHYSLIQTWLLGEELKACQTLKTEHAKILDDIESIAESIIEDIPEDELPEECSPTDDKIGFAKSLCTGHKDYVEIAIKQSKEVKQLKKLFKEESLIKKNIKTANAQLLTSTKECLDSLSDEQCRQALGAKWIIPLRARLAQLPTLIIQHLNSNVQEMAKKYATTYLDLDTQISDTEQELSSMLAELTGSEHDMKAIAEFQQLLNAIK